MAAPFADRRAGAGTPAARPADLSRRREQDARPDVRLAHRDAALREVVLQHVLRVEQVERVDEPREAAREAIDLLRAQGVRAVALVTGDGRAAAQALAAQLGIDEVYAELLPEDKVDTILRLRRRHGPVAMVGDGVNDAPALAAADVGIAMGVAGTDAALETADVALMADELLKIPYAIRLSRATLRTMRTNIVFSIAFKAVFLVLAVLGAATLWMAVVADMGASLLVIANALRLLRAD